MYNPFLRIIVLTEVSESDKTKDIFEKVRIGYGKSGTADPQYPPRYGSPRQGFSLLAICPVLADCIEDETSNKSSYRMYL